MKGGESRGHYNNAWAISPVPDKRERKAEQVDVAIERGLLKKVQRKGKGVIYRTIS